MFADQGQYLSNGPFGAASDIDDSAGLLAHSRCNDRGDDIIDEREVPTNRQVVNG